MPLPLTPKDKMTLFTIVNNHLLKPQIDLIKPVLNNILVQQKELCFIPDNVPNRFSYRGKEYRQLDDLDSTAWAKVFPLHKSLHGLMPEFLALFEPYQLSSARIKSIIVNATAYANTYADLKALIPADALTQVSISGDWVHKPITLSKEEIEAFKTKHSQYLFAIHEALFKNVLLDL